MALFLAHTILLLGSSHATARALVRSHADRLLAVLLLAWGNIVATSLGLALLHKLGEPAWYFRTSLVLAGLTWLGLRRLAPEPPPEPAGGPAGRADPRLLAAFVLTLLPVAWIALRIAATYVPNNYDSLTYHLPRAMFYLGQDTLAHFDTGNPRQTYFPFNYNLLQAFCLVYGAPLQALNFINLAAWAAAGLAIYRLARLAGAGVNAALVACWLAVTSTQILAQGTATTNDLPTAAGLLAALVFGLRWRAAGRARDAWLTGLAAGLTAGSKLTVIFFAPAAGLIGLGLVAAAWRRRELPAFFRAARGWFSPAALAGTFAAPFALINLAEKGEWINHTYDFTLNRPFRVGSVLQTAEAYLVQFFLEPLHRFTFDLDVTARLNEWGTRTFFPHWNPAYAFSPLYLFPPDLNEDHVWFGFTGPFILLCAVYGLVRFRRVAPPISWLALLGLGWLATYFVLNKWSLYNQRYFVLCVLVLSPCTAAAIEAAWSRPGLRRTVRTGLTLLAATALWTAGIYLFQNTSRPYAPLWAGQPPPPALPAMPALMVDRIARQPHVNVDSTDGNERIFLFMSMGRGQRFTAFERPQPDAYNLFSEWGFVRKVAYSNIEQLSSYTTVEIPTKPTAGVEFLGTLGRGQPAIDYLGLAPHPETLPATSDNRQVLVVLYYGPRDPGRYSHLRIKVAGLNAPDRARLQVGVDYADGTAETLATFTSSGELPASVNKPFHRFTIRVKDEAGGEIGKNEIPYFAREETDESEAPHDPLKLFSEQLVTVAPSASFATEGLAGPEGPYPQWNLPVIRWAKAPVVRLELPAYRHLERLDLSFALALHVHEAADIDVLLNGEMVQSYHWEGPTRWLIQTLHLRPRAGPNVIEFRHVKVGPEPDWADYLARYPDVKANLEANGIALEAGARRHWETHGQHEGRQLFHHRDLVTVPEKEQLYYLFRDLRVEGFR